jgi:hypothetical protein
MMYIENKKILNQLKMLKKTQELMSKNIGKEHQNTTTNEKYTSLWKIGLHKKEEIQQFFHINFH